MACGSTKPNVWLDNLPFEADAISLRAARRLVNNLLAVSGSAFYLEDFFNFAMPNSVHAGM